MGSPPGGALPSHGSKSLRKSSEFKVQKDGVWSLRLPFYRSSLCHVAAKKARGTAALTYDYGGHGLLIVGAVTMGMACN